ncbi:MAG: PKD domain-containing protein [Ignavibacteriales bacterium]
MKSYNILISVILMLCLVGEVCAAANAENIQNMGSDGNTTNLSSDGNTTNLSSDGDTTTLSSDGKKHANSMETVELMKHAPNGVRATKSIVANTLSNTLSFTSIPTTGNCVDNSKKIAIYMPTMTSQLVQGTTDAIYDPYCTAMFFEYNPDYLNNSIIASKLTKANYDLLIVPKMEMSNTAANAINNYLSNGGCVWFLNDPSLTETDAVAQDRINILGGTADSGYNLIGSASTINVDNTDDITNSLPSQFNPMGTTKKWSFFRSLTGSGTISGFNYRVLMSTGDCAMLVKFENPTTGARAIYSNVNMFISGGECSYFNTPTATKLFLLTKAWILKLGINEPRIQITYPNSDKQFTLTIDDVKAASGEPALTAPFFAMENSVGVSPASVNTFFLMPSSAIESISLQNYASNGDTHSMHSHSFIWTDNSQSVSQYKTNIAAAEAYVNNAMSVGNYGFTSWRFPYTSYCSNSQKAVASSGYLIDSSNGRWTGGVYIGDIGNNNLLFPKQMLLNSEKTNVVELEATSIYDLDSINGNDFYQKQLENYPYLKNVNFPANFVVGAHYQGAMTNVDLMNGIKQILTSVQDTGTSYATFSTLSTYMTNVKNARITALTSGNTTIVTVITTNPITDFTIKVATDQFSSATCDGASVSVKQDSLTGSSYITQTIGGGTHTFVIEMSTPSLTPPVATFNASSTTGVAPAFITFTDKSTGSPISWSWTFGDGGTSNLQNPSYTFKSAGTFNVALTVNNSAGITNTTSQTITISAPASNYIHIDTIKVTTNSRRVGRSTLVSATAVVKILDNASQPVKGATVSGHWSGATVDTDSAVTSDNGIVTVKSNEVTYKRGTLTFTFTVDNVSHSIAWDKIVKSGTGTYR